MAAEDENESGLVDVLQRASDLLGDPLLDKLAAVDEDESDQKNTPTPLPHDYRQFLGPSSVGVPGLKADAVKSTGAVDIGKINLPDPKEIPAIAKEGNLNADKVPSSASAAKQQQGTGKGAKGKAKATKRRSWKKPKDKPKRPLSAYNLFFQHERERIIAATAAPPEDDKKDEAPILGPNGKPKRRRRHRKTHGKISFADLARNISTKWKELDGPGKAPFETRAAVEQERYKKEIEIWKRKKAKEQAERELALQDAKEEKCDTVDAMVGMTGKTALPPACQRRLSDEQRRRSTAKTSNSEFAAAAAAAAAAIGGQRRLSDEQRRRSTAKAGNSEVASAAAAAAAAVGGELDDDDDVFLSMIEDLESYEEQKTRRKPAHSYLANKTKPSFISQMPVPVQRVTSEDLAKLEPISISTPAVPSYLEPVNVFPGAPRAQPEYTPSTEFPCNFIDHSTPILLSNDRLRRICDIVDGAPSGGNGIQSSRPMVNNEGTAFVQHKQQHQQSQFEISTVPLRGESLQQSTQQDSVKCMRELLSGLKQGSELSMGSCRSILNNESMRDILQTMRNGTDVTKEESMRNILDVMKAGPNRQKSSRTFKTDDESMAEMLLSFESLDSSLKDKFIGSMSTMDTTLTFSQPQTTTS